MDQEIISELLAIGCNIDDSGTVIQANIGHLYFWVRIPKEYDLLFNEIICFFNTDWPESPKSLSFVIKNIDKFYKIDNDLYALSYHDLREILLDSK